MECTKKLALLTALATLTTLQSSAQSESRVIYGDDNRKDLFEVTNPDYRKLSDSTVALIQERNLSSAISGQVSIKSSTLQSVMRVCKTEPYYDQPSAAFCSGSLIGKNLVLTAGHCIADQDDCNQTKMVFNFDVNAKGKYPNAAPSSEVYSCKSIIHREQNGTGADFAIIALDRNVSNHAVLKLAQRKDDNLEKGAKLLMIGHPSGIPTKIDDGGMVRDPNPHGFFVATTDSYGGNSGSAVFNLKTLEIEGVLVRGEQDFKREGTCYVSNICKEDACRGEDVTKIASVIPFLPSVRPE